MDSGRPAAVRWGRGGGGGGGGEGGLGGHAEWRTMKRTSTSSQLEGASKKETSYGVTMAVNRSANIVTRSQYCENFE